MTDSRRAALLRIARFLLVGGTSVLIDAGVYWLLSILTGSVLIAKPAGYIAGAIFGYFANWKFTFGARRGRWSELAFIVVYASSLGINLGMNELALHIFPAEWWRAPAAFLFTTAITTVWNFFGMHFFVFRAPAPGTISKADVEEEQLG